MDSVTFANFLDRHQDATVRTAAQWCRAGPIDLADALRELDAVGAPGVASLAIRVAWGEWYRAEGEKKNATDRKKSVAPR